MSLIARPRTSRLRATTAAFLVTLFAAACALGAGAVSASASSGQLGMFEEPTFLQQNPVAHPSDHAEPGREHRAR